MPKKKENRALELIHESVGFVIIFFFAGLLGLGFFEPESSHLIKAIACAISIIMSIADIYLRLQGKGPATYLKSIEGPLLWTVTFWQLYRIVAGYAIQAIFIPASFLAWLFVSYPLKTTIPAFTLAVAIEIGFLLNNIQPLYSLVLNIIFYVAAMAALTFFVKSKVHRRNIKKALERKRLLTDTEERANDFGLVGNTPELLRNIPDLFNLEAPQSDKQTIDDITASFDMHLEMLRRGLDLTTAAILSIDSDKNQMRLRNLITARKDIQPGPYQISGGISSALTAAGSEIALAPAKGGSWSLPYYKNQDDVGGLFALRIPSSLNPGERGIKEVPLILCVDRASSDPWLNKEKDYIRLAAKKLSLELSLNRRFLIMDTERSAMQRLSVGLRELNNVLGLEHVFDVSIKVIRSLVDSDCIVITLLGGEFHTVVKTHGSCSEMFQDQRYPASEGLAGQALKLRSSMPLKSEYGRPMPIFSNAQRIEQFKSLLVIPLIKQDGKAVGTLTVANEKPGVFSKTRREFLELIAAQIAIKIDLGQAYEKINKLATTDGLTELANHRTFQHGFDIMIERAKRQSTPVSLILCDLDFFKKINDTYGHPFGDHVLRLVAEILKKAVRTVDLAARYGGEEFAIVLEGSDKQGGLQMAERIRKEIESLLIMHQGEKVPLTMSLGISAHPVDGEEKKVLIDRADQALYQAKKNGRNRVVAWTER